MTLYGDKANPKTFAARFASPDGSEILSVVVRPTNQLKITFLEAKDIIDLGSLKEAAKLFVPGGSSLYSARTIKIKEDEGFRTYYFYEFGRDEQHVALVAVVNSGKETFNLAADFILRVNFDRKVKFRNFSSSFKTLTTQEFSAEHLSSAMEQQVLSTCESSLDTLQSLASIRSLITNSHTSNSTTSSILETLTHSLQHSPDSLTGHHKLKLLTDLAATRVHLCPDILNSLLFDSFLSAESSHADAESHRVAVDSLISLSSILEIDGNLPRPVIDDALLVSMCFGPSVSARLWLLRNAEKLGAKTHIMLTVFLGFTKDPYPYVREAALDGLTRLARYGAVFEDYNVVEGCYCRAVELLQDNEDVVRSAAIRVVSEWGQMLVRAANEEEDKREWPNVVFIQLCAMVRDMSVEVRIEAFNTLGRIQIVSEEILLQTLSKKVLWNGKEKTSARRCVAGRFEVSASGAAGVFVHGLEDEFYEVRKSACISLRVLTILSAEFAGRSLNLLTDMLNDDSMVVRLEALVALHYMTTFECLKLQEMHMHMFIGTLRDGSAVIRSTARKVFKSAKLPNLQLFRLSINGLLENLELHPQDEAEIFSVLFHMGRNHGKFAARVVQDVLPEIEPFSEGELNLDSARVAAFLVLSISAPISCDQDGCSIPPRLFSYAVTLLGRLSHSLKDVLDQSTLLAYMFQCSRSSSSSVIEFEGRDTLLVIDNLLNCPSVDGTYHARIPSLQVDTGLLRSCKSNITTSPTECEQEDNEVFKSLSLILAKASDAWLLVQTNRTDEAVMTLRSCQEEASVFSIAMPECASALAFTLHFIKVMKLLSKVWEQIVWNVRSNEIVGLGILLGELDSRLRELRCSFVGFSKEEEFHVLELLLVSCILKLSKVEISCHRATLKKLSALISHIEHLLVEGTVEPSNFIVEVKLIYKEVGSLDDSSYNPFLFMKLVNLFTLRRFTLCRVRHIHAELDVLDNDSENPLPFVAGLPVAIPLEIIIHNVASEIKLWLRIALNEESAQFVFLDSSVLGGCGEVKKFRFDAPFYRTPKSCSFSLSVCIGMECWFEELQFRQSRGGPKHALTYICREKEVYLCLAQNNL